MNRDALEMTMKQGLAQCGKNTRDDVQLIACSRQVISAQLQTHSAAYLMDEIATSSVPKQFGDCHGIAHLIGEETFNKFNNLERAINECPLSCYGGCVHGIVAGAVKAEYGANDPGADIAHMDVGQIEKIGAKYCDSIRLCHGIGHILYYVTNNLEQAAQACGTISSGFAHEMCVSGAFMQGVGDIHHSLAMSNTSAPQPAVSNGDPAFPCNTVSTQYQHQCFLYVPSYQEAYFKARNITDSATRLSIAKESCENQKGPAREYCFEGMGYAVFRYIPPINEDYVTPALQLCQNLPTLADQKSCVLGFVEISRGYGFIRQSYSFCSSLSSSALKTFCYFSNFENQSGPTGGYSAESACRYSATKDQCFAAHDAYESQYATLPDYRFGLYGLKK